MVYYFLSRLFIKALRLFMPAERFDPEIPPLSRSKGEPVRELVDLWKYHLGLHYTSLEHIAQSQVTSISWYKYSEGLEHEYLVATVERKVQGDISYLRIERRASSKQMLSKDRAMDPNITKNYNDKQMNEYEASIAHETTALQRILGNLQSVRDKSKDTPPLADDTVIRVRSPRGELGEGELEPIKLVATYDSFQNPFSLRDLGFIAFAVNEKAEVYLFLVNQCYWFARTVIDVIKYRYSPHETAGEFFERAGSFKNQRIKINGDDPRAVAQIAASVKVALDEHDSHVHGKYLEATRAQRAEEELNAARERERLLEQQLKDMEAQVAALTANTSQK